MRHRIKDDIYPKGISDFLGEVFEVIFVFALALPSVPVVRVVRGKDHHPPFVVVQHTMMDRPGVFPRQVERLTGIAEQERKGLLPRCVEALEGIVQASLRGVEGCAAISRPIAS